MIHWNSSIIHMNLRLLMYSWVLLLSITIPTSPTTLQNQLWWYKIVIPSRISNNNNSCSNILSSILLNHSTNLLLHNNNHTWQKAQLKFRKWNQSRIRLLLSIVCRKIVLVTWMLWEVAIMSSAQLKAIISYSNRNLPRSRTSLLVESRVVVIKLNICNLYRIKIWISKARTSNNLSDQLTI